MKTLISHFYNESYLLPWWLKHHREIFDYGVMINHGSTDESMDIIREYVPHWRLVNSTLTSFNAFMTDLEVMNYEKELPGWKIALNTTEFLICSLALDDLTRFFEKESRYGAACTGHIIVDTGEIPNLDRTQSLVKQLHWGFNENINFTPEQRISMNLGVAFPARNRFFHRLPVGMYQPGRHLSHHPDSSTRFSELMVWHYAWAPWNPESIARKMSIKSKLDPQDVLRGWGSQHTKSIQELNSARQIALSYTYDLTRDDVVRTALDRL
jgi:hypothetical protein